MSCTLSVVIPNGLALAATLTFGAGAEPLAVGSLVREVPGACAAGVPVEVLSVNPTYGSGGASVGDRGCVAPGAIAPASGMRAVALISGASFAAGDVLGPIGAAACGDTVPVGAIAAPVSELAKLRPASAERLDAAELVRAAYAERFGAIGLHEVPFTDWGFVGLPLPSPVDAAAMWAAEGLDTPTRREKAVVANGPTVDGGVVYAHFLGTDAPGSDAWGRPETVVALLALADGWYRHCAVELAADPALRADAANCTLQVGDLAWYNGKRPDPLGHSDHFEGTCVDLRLFRTDGSRYEAWWNRPDDRPGRGEAYNRPLTQAFLAWAIANGGATTAYFNDPAVIAAVPGVVAAKGHDDHMHLCFD